LRSIHKIDANLANIFGVRQAIPPKNYTTLSGRSFIKSGTINSSRKITLDS
jgi:hypothetical protein